MTIASLRHFLSKQWFLISLTCTLVLGFSFHSSLAWLAAMTSLRYFVLIAVLFLMALPLETKTIWETIRHPWAAILASLINMGILPVLAYFFSMTLKGDLATGVILAAVAPCTLASAAVWTRKAGGNDTVALLVTVVTNLTCFCISPLWLYLFVGRSGQIDLSDMIFKLGLLVVLPMAFAQLVRRQAIIGNWATTNKHQLGSTAQLGILTMVLIGSIRCGQELNVTDWQNRTTSDQFAVMIVTVLTLHTIVLYAGKWLASRCGMRLENQIAVGIAGSQKTLMVGLHLAITYFGGLTMLPMVAYHIGQLFIDTIVADRWNPNAHRET